MMTNRSSHIPISTMMDEMNSSTGLLRIFLNHSNCGAMMLHETSDQYDAAYGPVMRFQIAAPSYTLPLYQPVKPSRMYAYATISPVASITLAALSRCLSVIRPLSPYAARSGMASTSTI